MADDWDGLTHYPLPLKRPVPGVQTVRTACGADPRATSVGTRFLNCPRCIEIVQLRQLPVVYNRAEQLTLQINS